jgi:hypothetical protein
MEEKDDIYKNLVTFLKLFKNRPYHLAKFLIDKKGLTDKFKKDIINSDKLSELDNNEGKNNKGIYFSSISQMEDYFQSLLEAKELKSKTPEQIESELNQKLDELLSNEKYEDAACLRDYMVMKGFKRKFKF